MITITTSFVKNSFGYGRILRNSVNEIEEIVEESDLDERLRQINEINAGLYMFNYDWLKKYLLKLDQPDFGEYKLTDLVKFATSNGFQISSVEADEQIVYGVNTLDELKQLEDLISDFMMWWSGKSGHYKNTNHCQNKFGLCPFVGICLRNDKSRHFKRKTVFRELQEW